jgi:hypothetical protein
LTIPSFSMAATPERIMNAPGTVPALRHFRGCWWPLVMVFACADHSRSRSISQLPRLWLPWSHLLLAVHLSLAPPLSPNTYWTSRADISPQETLRRVPTSSRPVAPSATPSRRTVATRSVPLCTASSAARPVPSRVTPTPTPTSRRASPGTTTPCSPTSRTPRSTSLVPRWPSVVSRRRRTGTT